MYTSGTTGNSKACMITHNYLCHAGRQLVDGGQQASHETLFMPLPFFQINAISSATGTLLAQGTLSLAAGFDIATFWSEIRRTGATVTALLASMVQAVTNADVSDDERACVGQVRIVRGGPFSAEEDVMWRERFGVQRVGSSAYGSTEVGRMTSVPLDAVPTPGTNGRRNEFYDVRIFDDEDRECPQGAVGEIVCRPNQAHIMFEGYWNRPEETVRAFRNLWFHTGDLGRFDDAGNLVFVDRRKHHLQSTGGISGTELEAIVRRHPGIRDVAAYEVPWPGTGAPTVAVAIVESGAPTEAAELWAWLGDQVPAERAAAGDPGRERAAEEPGRSGPEVQADRSGGSCGRLGPRRRHEER